MDGVDTEGGGTGSIDCFILSVWQTGDLIWLRSRRSASDDAGRDCRRWRDSDASPSLAVPKSSLSPARSYRIIVSAGIIRTMRRHLCHMSDTCPMRFWVGRLQLEREVGISASAPI